MSIKSEYFDEQIFAQFDDRTPVDEKMLTTDIFGGSRTYRRRPNESVHQRKYGTRSNSDISGRSTRRILSVYLRTYVVELNKGPALRYIVT